MLHAQNATPLYKQVKIALKNDILNQIYLPGDKIPTEPELRERFGVSRVTVRYAVEELEKEGFLKRTQGKGTFVTHRKIESDMEKVSGFSDLVTSSGGTPSRLILNKKVQPAGDWIAEHLQISSKDPVLYLERILSNSDSPVMHDTSYYPLSRFPGLDQKVDHNISTYGLLRDEYHVDINRAHKRFNVEIADVSISNLLKCQPGDPLFSILKVAYNPEGVSVHLSKALVMANHVTYVIDVCESEDGGSFLPRTGNFEDIKES